MVAVWIIKVFGICSVSRSCHHTSKLGENPLPDPLGLLLQEMLLMGAQPCAGHTGEICDLWPIVTGGGGTDTRGHPTGSGLRCVWQSGVLPSHRGQPPMPVSAHRALSLSFAAQDGAVPPLLPCTGHTWAPLTSQCCSAVQCTLQPFLATA